MIYFDLDGVLADMESGLMQNAEVKSLRVIVDDLISSKFTDYKGLVDDDIKTKFKAELESNPESEVKELKKAFSKYTSKVFSVASKPGFYRNLPLMPGSVEMVKKAGELSGELPNILSAPVGDENDLNNPSVIEKKEWVAEHFGELVNEVIITIDKGKVVKSKDDILIDDRPKYVEKFESAGGTAILYKDSVQATAELVKLIESKPSVVEKVSNKRWVKTFESFRKNLLLIP
jgi:5'(3')-deoxyribonucleotidase